MQKNHVHLKQKHLHKKLGNSPFETRSRAFLYLFSVIMKQEDG